MDKSTNSPLYDSSVCERVIAIMEQGGVLPDVMRGLEIDERTLTEWRQRYAEFNEAIETGLTYSEAFWEEALRTNLCNPAFDSEKAISVMVKHFGWVE
jgi:hypothetical protein